MVVFGYVCVRYVCVGVVGWLFGKCICYVYMLVYCFDVDVGWFWVGSGGWGCLLWLCVCGL